MGPSSGSSNNPILEAADLTKSYKGVRALNGVTLKINRGEIVGLLGPNGAGKTTLVSIIAGLRKTDSGTVTVAGIDVATRGNQARRHIGLAPQDLGIYPGVSVRDNLTLFGEIGGLSGQALKRRVEEVAESLGVAGLLARLAGTMSGGEKRRLHTAIALLHEPPLLLLDEPTTGADVSTRQDLLGLVRALAERGSAVLYSTHYLREVEDLGANVTILEAGRIIASDSVSALISRHGQGAVELKFSGILPQIQGAVHKSDGVLRITADDAAAAAASALATVGEAASRLESIEIIHPSLESVYLGLTGRRYSPEGTDDQDSGRAADGGAPAPGKTDKVRI